jgi:anti-anti-sigma regulatory factor
MPNESPAAEGTPVRGANADQDAHSLALPAELTLNHARAVRDLLLDALQGHPKLILDGGAVTECDVAGLQLLPAAVRSAKAMGGGVSFAPGKRSEVIDRVARAAGLVQPDDGSGLWLGVEDHP